jgi:hypothetical protein
MPGAVANKSPTLPDYYLTPAPFSRDLIVDIPSVYCYDFSAFEAFPACPVEAGGRLDPIGSMRIRLHFTRHLRIARQKATPK